MPYRLIVAESSPSVMKAIQMAFPEPDYEVFLCPDGLEFEKALDQVTPDVVVLDLFLPKKDGFQLALDLKNQEKYRGIPLILLKGAFDPVDQLALEMIRFNEIVETPFDSLGLEKTVRGLLGAGKDPQTLPEEPALHGTPESEKEDELDERVSALVQKEIDRAEKGLAEKLKAHLLSELKEYIQELMQESQESKEESPDKEGKKGFSDEIL